MKELFPENAVEYFVSYYDYYQPEAYVPASDTYIDKDASSTTRSIACVTRRRARCSRGRTPSSSLRELHLRHRLRESYQACSSI